MISVSEVSAFDGLLDGLRLPRRRFRPSPKPIAADGMPIARMREQTTAARPENRNDFMPLATRGLHQSCGPASRLSGRGPQRSPGCFAGLTDTGIDRSSAVRIMRFFATVWAAG